MRVDLGSGGANILIALEKLKEIEHAVVSQSQSLTIHGSGSDVVLNSTALTRCRSTIALPEMEIQMPGAARGANGVVHINGDHGVINYMIDGVPLPQELNRDIGSEINLNDLSFVDLIEGAYPAQYGLKFRRGFQHVDAGRDRAARLRRIRIVRFVHQCPIDDRISRADRGRRGLRRRVQRSDRRRADSIRPTSTRLTTMRARSVSSRASRCPPAGTTSRTLRLSIATTRFRFPTTSPTASRPTPTITRPSRHVPGGPVSPCDRQYGSDHVRARRTTHRGSKISAIPTNDWIYGESLNVDAAPLRQRRHVDGLRQCFRLCPDESDGLSDDVRLTRSPISGPQLDYIMQGDYTQSFGSHTLGAGVNYDLESRLEVLCVHAAAE